MGFLRQSKDGTTSLAIIVPNDGIDPETNERPISLGALVGKLNHGTGSLQGFREDRRNLTKPGTNYSYISLNSLNLNQGLRSEYHNFSAI